MERRNVRFGYNGYVIGLESRRLQVHMGRELPGNRLGKLVRTSALLLWITRCFRARRV